MYHAIIIVYPFFIRNIHVFQDMINDEMDDIIYDNMDGMIYEEMDVDQYYR